MTSPLILASHSPRRIEMLTTCGYAPQVVPSAYEEVLPMPLLPREQAMFYAFGKAMDVAGQLEQDLPENAVIVGADTVVVFAGRILEKPKDKEDALSMLMDLSGRTHHVVTGVCLLSPGLGIKRCFADVSSVTFKEYTAEELAGYLDTPEPYDKAGAYGIQGTFGKYTVRTCGDINNVIGFPLERFQKEMETLGL